jgi:hypothetical protein
MRPIGITTVTLALAASLCLAQSNPSTLIGRLTGKWIEDQSKAKLGSTVSLRFRSTAAGALEELRGPEANPVVQPVNFDGKAYPIEGGNQIAWKRLDPSRFERQIFDGRTSPAQRGRLVTTRTIQIAADGKTLTEETDRILDGGRKSVTTVTFLRTSGEARGLAGVWKPQSFRSDTPDQRTIEPAGTDGFKMSDNAGATYTVHLDGKPVPVTGPTIIPDTTVAAKFVDDRTLELIRSRKSVASTKTTVALSGDGKTLTFTTSAIGPGAGGEPSMEVYKKQ